MPATPQRSIRVDNETWQAAASASDSIEVEGGEQDG